MTHMTTPELLSLLECALLYGNRDMVEEISKLLGNSFEASNNVLEQLQKLEDMPFLNIDKVLFARIKSKFTKYLSKHFCPFVQSYESICTDLVGYFCPLEVRTVTHADFLSCLVRCCLCWRVWGEVN